MQLLKRVLLFFVELGVLFLGLAGTIGVAYILERREANDSPLASIAFFVPLILSVVGFFFFRHRNRRWKIEYDAANWLSYRSSQRLHPRRTRNVQIARRWLQWFPSACAALVLFFLPVASRIACPGAQFVRGYRASIPMNWIIISNGGSNPNFLATALFSNEGASRYGLTPMWFNHSLPSGVSLDTSDPAISNEWYRPTAEAKDGSPTHVAKTAFAIGTMTVTCWEYRDTFDLHSSPRWLYPPVLWEVLCSSQPNGRNYNLRASFLGQKEDIPSFYQVLKNLTPNN
jgi:hypothetical protein